MFNSRMQPTQIGLGNGVNSQNLLKLDYEYGATASVNNGNVTKQTITVPGVAHPFVQTYAYDELNRLTNAEETQNSVQTWEQTFTYDRFGNRNYDQANTTFAGFDKLCSGNTVLCADLKKKRLDPAINTSNNRLSTSDDYAFDSSGNTTADAEGRTFVYDAENKQVEVIESSVTIGEYFYDGDGKRIKKVTASEITVFVYDAAGKLIGEYSTVVQSGSNAKTVYTTNDHLGSPRINTDGTGQVISRHDYHPFGEEIARTGYGSDTLRKQFTGYERDNESELDYAQARMFNYSHGRFTSPDDFLNDTHPIAPQSWNLYVYVRNNPLKYIDPTGEEIWVSFQEEEEYEEDGEKKKRTVTRRVQYRNGALYNQDGSDYTGNNQYALNARDYLNALSQDSVLGSMINQMDRSKKVHTIMRDPNNPDENWVDPTRTGTNIYWSGKDKVIQQRVDGSSRLVDVTHSAIFILAHEALGHAWFVDRGIERNRWLKEPGINCFGGQDSAGNCGSTIPLNQAEVDAISVENRARILLGGKAREFWGRVDVSELLTNGDFISPRKRPELKRR